MVVNLGQTGRQTLDDRGDCTETVLVLAATGVCLVERQNCVVPGVKHGTLRLDSQDETELRLRLVLARHDLDFQIGVERHKMGGAEGTLIWPLVKGQGAVGVNGTEIESG